MERNFAQEHEEALAENSAKQAEVRKTYRIRDAIRRSNEIVSVLDDTLGEVRFGVLTIEEFQNLNLSTCKTKEEMLQAVVAAMFRKADPEITLDAIKTLPADDYTIIAGIVGSYLPGFLRVGQQILKAGSTPTQPPKK